MQYLVRKTARQSKNRGRCDIRETVGQMISYLSNRDVTVIVFISLQCTLSINGNNAWKSANNLG